MGEEMGVGWERGTEVGEEGTLGDWGLGTEGG